MKRIIYALLKSSTPLPLAIGAWIFVRSYVLLNSPTGFGSFVTMPLGLFGMAIVSPATFFVLRKLLQSSAKKYQPREWFSTFNALSVLSIFLLARNFLFWSPTYDNEFRACQFGENSVPNEKNCFRDLYGSMKNMHQKVTIISEKPNCRVYTDNDDHFNIDYGQESVRSDGSIFCRGKKGCYENSEVIPCP